MSILFTTALALTLLTPPVNATNAKPLVHEAHALSITEPDELDLYIERLAFLESGGRADIDIIDTNGKHSRGCLQFQDETFIRYADKYDITGDIFDCAVQKRLAKEILLRESGGWRNWFTSVTTKGLGKPPV